MAKKKQQQQKVYFAPYGALPQVKGRTPEWDSEEEELFSEQANDEYLKSKGLDYTRDGIYYLDSKGKYMPGTIYYNDNGNWSHYELDPYYIKGFNFNKLSLDQYKLLQTLGIDLGKYYNNGKFPEELIPLEPKYIQSKIPKSNYKIGNSTIEYTNDMDASTIQNQEQLDEYLNNFNYHIVDPDNGYDFNITNGTVRDGGSKYIEFSGKYPEEWNELYQRQVYKASSLHPGKAKDAEKIRNTLNELFKNYNIQFKKGGKLIPRKRYIK